MAFSVPPESIPNFVGGCLMLALAAGVFLLRPRDRLNRAFAVFLVVRGSLNATALAWDPSFVAGPVLQRWAQYHALALPFAVAWFVGVAALPRRRFLRPFGWALLALLATSITAMLAQPSLWGGYEVDNRGGTGPLYLVYGLLGPSYGVGAYLLARQAWRMQEGPRRRSLLLLAAAFLLPATYVLADVPRLVTTAPSVWVAAAAWLRVLVVVPLALLAVGAAKQRAGAGRTALAVSAAAVTVAGAAVALSGDLGAVTFVDGLLTLAMPLLAAYAILRYELFGIELRLKWTISRGTIAGAFVSIFFVVSEVAQAFFSERAGPVLGVLAAGALLLVLAPLQRAGKRVADAALPHVAATPEYGERRRLEIYRAALEASVASDAAGDLLADPVLRALRSRLRISDREHALVDADVRGGARWREGDLLLGRYRVVREIETAASGRTLAAHDVQADRPVLLRVSRARGPAEAARLLEEARRLAALDDPAAPTLYALELVGEDVVAVLESRDEAVSPRKE